MRASVLHGRQKEVRHIVKSQCDMGVNTNINKKQGKISLQVKIRYGVSL